MKITVTFQEMFDRDWNKFCDITGINPWCVNEGLASWESEYQLTKGEALLLGLLNDN